MREWGGRGHIIDRVARAAREENFWPRVRQAGTDGRGWRCQSRCTRSIFSVSAAWAAVHIFQIPHPGRALCLSVCLPATRGQSVCSTVFSSRYCVFFQGCRAFQHLASGLGRRGVGIHNFTKSPRGAVSGAGGSVSLFVRPRFRNSYYSGSRKFLYFTLLYNFLGIAALHARLRTPPNRPLPFFHTYS